jgi:DNA-binding Xre family transcriptional regulator
MGHKEVTVAQLALRTGIDRKQLRSALGGSKPLLVDDLLLICRALELDMTDLEGLAPEESTTGSMPRPVPVAATHLPTDEDSERVTIDPWGNHVEQLFRAGFALGCDFVFVADTALLSGSGVPQSVLDSFEKREFVVKLDAAYHNHNLPKYTEESVQLRLSFDTVCTCTFPWSAVKRVVFLPATPDAPSPEEPEGKVTHLRLVT